MTVIIAPADTEAIVDGVAMDLLSPGFLERLRLEWHDREFAIPFVTPEVVYTSEIETPSGYPCAEVIAIEENDDQASEAENLDVEISVQWTITGDNEQVMDRTAKRYIRATRRYFRGRSLHPHVRGGRIRTGRADFSQITLARNPQGGNSRFLKSASIQLFMQTIGG